MPLVDYTTNNPDTLTKYKQAAQISQQVLAEVSGMLDSSPVSFRVTDTRLV